MIPREIPWAKSIWKFPLRAALFQRASIPEEGTTWRWHFFPFSLLWIAASPGPQFPPPFPWFQSRRTIPKPAPLQNRQGEGMGIILWVVINGSSSPRKAVVVWDGCSLFAWEQWDPGSDGTARGQALINERWSLPRLRSQEDFITRLFNSNLGRISGRLHCQEFFFSRWQNGKRRWKGSDGRVWGEGKSFPSNSNQKAGKWKQKKKKKKKKKKKS